MSFKRKARNSEKNSKKAIKLSERKKKKRFRGMRLGSRRRNTKDKLLKLFIKFGRTKPHQ